MAHDSLTGCDLLVWAEDPSRVPMSSGRAQGMVVCAKNCPHKGWGNEERPTGAYRMKVIHVPDRTAEELDYLLDSEITYWDNDDDSLALDLPKQKKATLIRKQRIDISKMEKKDQDEILKSDALEHVLPGAKLPVIDDTGNAEITQQHPRKPRESAKLIKLAAIRAKLVPEPEQWETRKARFDGTDTKLLEAELKLLQGAK